MEARPIDANALVESIEELKRSPWYNGENGNYERIVRSYAIGTVVDLCAKAAPTLDYVPRQQWISINSEVKPRHGNEYLCVCTLPDDPKHEWDWMSVLRWHMNGSNGYVDRPHFTDEGVNGMTVTHWMPLPKPPKEDEKDENA